MELYFTIAESAMTAEAEIRGQRFRWRITNREYDEIPDGYWLVGQRWDGTGWVTLRSTVTETIEEAIDQARTNHADWRQHSMIGSWWFLPIPRRAAV